MEKVKARVITADGKVTVIGIITAIGIRIIEIIMPINPRPINGADIVKSTIRTPKYQLRNTSVPHIGIKIAHFSRESKTKMVTKTKKAVVKAKECKSRSIRRRKEKEKGKRGRREKDVTEVIETLKRRGEILKKFSRVAWELRNMVKLCLLILLVHN